MNIKKHIQAKRQYTPPKIRIRGLRMESLLTVPSATVESVNLTHDPNDVSEGQQSEHGNPTERPWGPKPSGGNSPAAPFSIFDDEIQ